MSDVVQRAASKRWASTKTKNIYDDWDDEEEDDDYDYIEEEDEQDEQEEKEEDKEKEGFQGGKGVHQVAFGKSSASEEGVLSNQVGGTAKQNDDSVNMKERSMVDEESKLTKEEPKLIKEESKLTKEELKLTKEEPKLTKEELEFNREQPKRLVEELQAKQEKIAVETMGHVAEKEEKAVPSMKIPDQTDQVIVSKKPEETDISKSDVDSIDSYKQRSEKEHLERQHNLDIMEGLYRKISNQLSFKDESDVENDSQSWEEAVRSDTAPKVPDHSVAINVASSESSIDRSQARPVSMNNDPVLRASDTSRLDKDFEDLFEDFENLSFATHPGQEKNNVSSKADQTLAPDTFMPKIEPLSPGRSKGKETVSEYNGTLDISDNVSLSESDEGQGFRASKGAWDAANNRSRSTDLQSTNLQSTNSQSTNLQSTNLQPTELQTSEIPSSKPQPSVGLGLDMEREKHSIDTKDKLFNSGKAVSETQPKISPSNKNYDDGYDDDDDDDDDDGNKGFKASHGLWASEPDLDATPVFNLPKTLNHKKSGIFSSQNSPNVDSDLPDDSSIADSEQFNRPDHDDSYKEEKVFGDNFPSNSFDNESVYTDNPSEFRTSIFRNDFVNRSQQQHETFDSNTVSSSALAAASKYHETEQKNVTSAKDILGDNSFSSIDSTDRQKPEISHDISFAKDYLGLAEDDKSDESDSDDDRDAFKASGGLWASQDDVPAKALPKAPESKELGSSLQAKTADSNKARKEATEGEFLKKDLLRQETLSSAVSETISDVSITNSIGDITKDKSLEVLPYATGAPVPKPNQIPGDTTPLAINTATFGAKNTSTTNIKSNAPSTPQAAPRNPLETPKKTTGTSPTTESPAVPPKDPAMFSPRNYVPIQHNMQQIFNNTPEQVHLILRTVRKDEYLHDSGLHTWLDATLKSSNGVPKMLVTQIGPNTKAAYDAAAVKSQSGNHNPNATTRRMSLNSKINISSHRFLKGTKNVNKNVKGKLEEGFAKGLFKRKK